MLPSKLAKRGCFLIFLLFIAFYLYGLGHIPFLGPDEPRYVEVAREMLLRRDLITPTLGGHTWFEKPVLLYWMIGTSFRLFGFSEWAARLGPALCGLLTTVAVYVVGRRIEIVSGDRDLRGLGCWNALIMATMPGFIVFSRGSSFDIVVTLTLAWTLSLFLLAEIDEDEKRRVWLLVGFYACIGLSLLAKGLIGIVIPVGVLFFYFALRRRLPGRWFVSSLVWGIPLALAVSAIWYGPVIERNGRTFIDEFFIQHHFARYLSNKYHHPQPFYYYLLIIFPLAMPWLILALTELMRAKHWNWQGTNPLDKFRVFSLAWLLMPVLFFSFSGSKLPGYILPVLPAVALLAGEQLMRILASRQSSRAIWIMAVALLIAAFGIITAAVISREFPVLCAVLIVVPLLIAAMVPFFYTSRNKLASISFVAAIPACFVIASNCGVRGFVRAHSSQPLIAAANRRGYETAPLYMLHEIDRTAEYYAAGRLVYDDRGEPLKLEGAAQVQEASQARKGTVLVIVPLRHLEQLTELKSGEVQVIATNRDQAIVAVRAL